jgi:hypothetical protein
MNPERSGSATKQLEFTATTSVEHAIIAESGNLNTEFAGTVQDDFNPGMVEKVGEAIGNGTQSGNQGKLVYNTPAGDVVTAQFFLEEESFGGHACQVGGTTNYS